MKFFKKIALGGGLMLAIGTTSNKAFAQSNKSITFRDTIIAPYNVSTRVIPIELGEKIKKICSSETAPSRKYTVSGTVVANMLWDYAEYVNDSTVINYSESDCTVYGTNGVMVYNIDTTGDGLADKSVQFPVDIRNPNKQTKYDKRGKIITCNVNEYDNRGGMPITKQVLVKGVNRRKAPDKHKYYVRDSGDDVFEISGRIVAQNWVSEWWITSADWGNGIVSYGGDIEEADLVTIAYFVDVDGNGISDICLQYIKHISDPRVATSFIGKNVSCEINRNKINEYDLDNPKYYNAMPMHDNMNDIIQNEIGVAYILNPEKSDVWSGKISYTPYNPDAILQSFITPEVLKKKQIAYMRYMQKQADKKQH